MDSVFFLREIFLAFLETGASVFITRSVRRKFGARRNGLNIKLKVTSLEQCTGRRNFKYYCAEMITFG